MSSVHRLNFASFLDKLASTRVSNHKICQIALVLFRSTFEEKRALCSPEMPDKEDFSRDIRSLAVADLLPAAAVLLHLAHVGSAIVQCVELKSVAWPEE
jgi:hypothetical protein